MNLEVFMNLWHDVNRKRIQPDHFLACIEISKGSKTKYELDKETGAVILDRILFTSTHYPQNYGFIPRTYAGDLDPLDVLVLTSEPIVPLALVECYPIGVFKMIDNGKVDEKIIAICTSDPVYSSYKDLKELPDHIFNEMRHFFQVYKMLEGKDTFVSQIEGKEQAMAIIKQSITEYSNHFE
jgi:inorganic pyrophosphatase